MDAFDTIVIGAGAAGMFCALHAGRGGRRVLLLEHSKSVGEKIRISGGGRCNFTNLFCRPEAFLSVNPKFTISALKRFTPQDFLELIRKHDIAWHEKTLGQLFCDGSAGQIIQMLVDEMHHAGVTLRLKTGVQSIARTRSGYSLTLSAGKVRASSLVIATGGKSIPKIGASGFGYKIAKQFGLPVTSVRPALVPLVFAGPELAQLKPLAGLSVHAAVSCNGVRFEEGLLFTHRGLSGPSVLQISSYWREGDRISVDLMPNADVGKFWQRMRQKNGRQQPLTALATVLPHRLAALVCKRVPAGKTLADLSAADLLSLGDGITRWELRPIGTEGFRTAEVTLGGVSTAALDSRTMEARNVPGLYFVGEVIDVTGWLGGYNFQWAWSSGWAAGRAIAARPA